MYLLSTAKTSTATRVFQWIQRKTTNPHGRRSVYIKQRKQHSAAHNTEDIRCAALDVSMTNDVDAKKRRQDFAHTATKTYMTL